MGFGVRLYILYASQLKGGGLKVWSHHDEVINLGHMGILEELKDASPLEYTPHQRAGIALFSCWFAHLTAKLQTKSHFDVFAPRFVTRAEMDANKLSEPYPNEIIEFRPLVENNARHPLALIRSKVETHNQVMALDRQERHGHLSKSDYRPITDPPFFWEASSTLVDQLNKAEAEDSLEWREIRTNSASLAIVRSRRAMLTELAEIGTRVLFVPSPH